VVKPPRRPSETHLMAHTLPAPTHQLSSDEAKHPATAAQQGPKVKHMLEAFTSDIGREYICYKDARVILQRCLLRRAHPAVG